MLIHMPICKNDTLHIGEGERNYTEEKSDTVGWDGVAWKILNFLYTDSYNNCRKKKHSTLFH